MTILNFPTTVRIHLPRRGELLIVSPDGAGVRVEGVNLDRGFGWGVGLFRTWPEAMEAARDHWVEEVVFHQHFRGAQ